LTEPDSKGKLGLFLGLAAAMYHEPSALLQHINVKEFIQLQELALEPLFLPPNPHTRYLCCQSCLPNRKLYFPSLAEITTHLRGIPLYSWIHIKEIPIQIFYCWLFSKPVLLGKACILLVGLCSAIILSGSFSQFACTQ
jgi:hypothetical protein